MDQSQDALNDALRLAYYGRPSFPCLGNKKPACTNGFKDATADPEELRELWRKYPGPLVGVPTGDVSGLFVVDVDCGRHHEANDWLESVSDRLPDTRWHATKSSGWHILFKHRGGLRNTAGKLARGVDTRGDGGYIIWWPFHLGPGKHKFGQLADIPEWLVAKLNPPPIVIHPRRRLLRSDSDLQPLIRTIASAREGERNTVTFWAACRLAEHVRNGQLGEGDMIGLVVEAGGRTGLSAREGRQIALSALRRA